MDDRRALMAAIIANPGEDTPRLALADWLQEHGDEHSQARAEFIRLQIEARRLTDVETRRAVEATAKKLERKHRKVWLKPLREIDDQLVARNFPPFTRGLLAHVAFPTKDFLRKQRHPALADALAEVGVEDLTLFDRIDQFEELATSSAVRWVGSFGAVSVDDRVLAALEKATNCTHLSKLTLYEAKVSDVGFEQFAKSTTMSRLRELYLTVQERTALKRSRFTASGILALLNSDRLPLLDSLSISDVPRTKFGWKRFFADTGLKKLTKLRLGEGIQVSPLVACAHLTNLRELAIDNADTTDEDAETLLANPAFSQVTKLTLSPMPGSKLPLSKRVAKKLRTRFGKYIS